MLGHLFRTSTNHKHRVNKKYNVEIKCCLERRPWEVQEICQLPLAFVRGNIYQFLTTAFFVTTFFEERFIKTKGDFHQWRIINLLKMSYIEQIRSVVQ
jgi:hypothetical protein